MFNHGINSLILFRYANQSGETYSKVFEEASKKFKGKIQFMLFDENDQTGQEFAQQFFKLSEEDLPTLRAVHFQHLEIQVPEEDAHETEEEITKFRFGGQERDKT